MAARVRELLELIGLAPDDVRRALARRALGRTTPARRRGARPRRRSAGAADGRAVRRARPDHAAPAAGRVPPHPVEAAEDGAAGHARHGRSDRAGGPDRRARRGPVDLVRARATPSPAARIRACGRWSTPSPSRRGPARKAAPRDVARPLLAGQPAGAGDARRRARRCSWLISTAIAVAVGVPLGVFAARRPRLGVAARGDRQRRPDGPEPGDVRVPAAGAAHRRRRRARRAGRAGALRAAADRARRRLSASPASIASIREAGVAMGMTPRELLRQVELPLALPSIIAGVRVAAVVGVGSATIAAAIGAGGLGQYIYRGLSMVDTTVILAGAIPAALLALVVDGGLLWLERQLSPRRRAAIASRRADGGRIARVPRARRQRRPGRAVLGRHRRGIEELHRAVDPRRDRRADDRARDRAVGPAPAEPGRHADLRSRARSPATSTSTSSTPAPR